MMYAMAITVPAFDISVNPWNMRIMDNKTDLLDILRSIAASVESIAQSLDDIADASEFRAAGAHQLDDDLDQQPTMYLSGRPLK